MLRFNPKKLGIGFIIITFFPIGIWFYYFSDNKVIEGVHVEGINLSDLTKDEAMEKMALVQKIQDNSPILLTFKEKSWVIQPEKTFFEIDLQKTTQKAWEIGRKGTLWEQWINRKNIKNKGISIKFVINFHQSEFNKILEKIKQEVDCNATSARIIGINNNQPIIIKETIGYQVDKKLFKQQLRDILIYNRSRQIKVPVIIDYPKLTRTDILQYHFKIIGDFTTEFDSNITERSRNIQLAAQAINGTILMPNETFSFNETVGNRVRERGYQQANIMLHGVLTPGIGGGVCQVSTTLYSAALFARLKIIERKNHERLINYVPPSQDATVLYGVIDLKFRNNRPRPILISSNLKEGNIYVYIWGQEIYPEEKVILQPIVNKVIHYPTIKKVDSTLTCDQQIVDQFGEDGYEVSLYRVILKNNLEIKKEFINKSQYAPQPEIMRIGN